MSKGNIVVRIIGGALAIAALAWFAYANSGASVDVDFVIFTLHDLSVAAVIYGSLIVGMLLILALGFRTDLRTRRQLRSAGGTGWREDRPTGSTPQAADAKVGEKTPR